MASKKGSVWQVPWGQRYDGSRGTRRQCLPVTMEGLQVRKITISLSFPIEDLGLDPFYLESLIQFVNFFRILQSHPVKQARRVLSSAFSRC